MKAVPRQGVIASEWLGETGNSTPWATSGIRQCLLEEGHCSDRWGQRSRGVRQSGKVKSGEQEGFRRDWIQVLYLLPPSNRWLSPCSPLFKCPQVHYREGNICPVQPSVNMFDCTLFTWLRVDWGAHTIKWKKELKSERMDEKEKALNLATGWIWLSLLANVPMNL